MAYRRRLATLHLAPSAKQYRRLLAKAHLDRGKGLPGYVAQPAGRPRPVASTTQGQSASAAGPSGAGAAELLRRCRSQELRHGRFHGFHSLG